MATAGPGEGWHSHPASRWVRIHRIELPAAERAAALPPDTAAVPFEAWVNGWMDEEQGERETVEVRTVTGRLVSGDLVDTRPGYQHSFGTPPPPLQRAGRQAFTLVAQGRDR